YDKHRHEIMGMGALADYLNDAVSRAPTLSCPLNLASCAPPALTDTDAMRWMGQPLAQLSAEGRSDLAVSVQAAALQAETEKRTALYSVIGSTGDAAVRELRAKGFVCEFETVMSVRFDGLRHQVVETPLYRCSKTDAAACPCRRFQVAISLEARPMGAFLE